MLIDEYLPSSDVTEVQEIQVKAGTGVTCGAIRETNLRDPMIDALFSIRELPDRLAHPWRGEAPRGEPEAVTLKDLETSEMGWVLLAEEPGVEVLVGAIGRFWQRDYGWHPVAPEQFTAFDSPGYAKLAVSFQVRADGPGRSILRYEARTATTNEAARERFARYWSLIHPGVTIVMRRAVKRIRDEAERRQAALVGAAG
jgi:hypothetical protein